VALITDGRFSGATSGAAIGHVSPEAAAGGPLALVEDGDVIDIDILAGKLNALVDEAEFARRREKLTPFANDAPAGSYLERYSCLVTSAMSGAVFKNMNSDRK